MQATLESSKVVVIKRYYSEEANIGLNHIVTIRVIETEEGKSLNIDDIRSMISWIKTCYAHKRDQNREILKHLKELLEC